MREMRRAFTLLELMVVVGIMAFLGLAAASGYNALKRGMADRSAVDSVSAFLRAAKERACIDRVPTAVFFWNRCVREATDDDNAVVVGEAVAVRRSGRITWVANDLLYDEFGDLNRSYDTYDNTGNLRERKGFRLWHISDSGNARMEYSIVADGVYSGKARGTSFMPLADGTGNASTNCDIRACAFYKLDDAKFTGWNAGMAYGMEFKRLRLPDGFIFGSAQPPTTIGAIAEVTGSHNYFDPEQIVGNVGDYQGNTVEISFCRPNAGGIPEFDHKAGVASAKEQ